MNSNQRIVQVWLSSVQKPLPLDLQQKQDNNYNYRATALIQMNGCWLGRQLSGWAASVAAAAVTSHLIGCSEQTVCITVVTNYMGKASEST
jgi:hypothetical protein